MAWRPYENLIDGELDNRTPGMVTGWMRFVRRGAKPLRVIFDLAGDFHEDIRGKAIRLSNPQPSEEDPDAGRSYMEGFARVQRGEVGDITAGLPLGQWTEALAQKFMAQNERVWDKNAVHGAEREARRQEFAERYRAHIAAGDPYYPYVDYPYIEWYSDNGRVVLELDPTQVEVLDGGEPRSEKTPEELAEDARKRKYAFGAFMAGMVRDFSDENRKSGGDGDVTGIAVG